MAGTATTPLGGDRENRSIPTRAIPWRTIFRIVRWSSYAAAVVTLVLVLHKAPAPSVEVNPQAAARVEQKFQQVEQAVSNGQPATMRMDQTELNSYLVSHLDMQSNPNSYPSGGTPSTGAAQNSGPGGSSNVDSTGAAALDLAGPAGTSAEELEQVRSSVKDVKVELVDDKVRAYVVFNFHGKDLTLQLEGKLGAQDGYLHFEPVAGQLGSLPIPQATLEAAVRRMMESPENREKLKLPNDMSGLKIENGEIVTTYK
jgi:hypothetical protein